MVDSVKRSARLNILKEEIRREILSLLSLPQASDGVGHNELVATLRERGLKTRRTTLDLVLHDLVKRGEIWKDDQRTKSLYGLTRVGATSLSSPILRDKEILQIARGEVLDHIRTMIFGDSREEEVSQVTRGERRRLRREEVKLKNRTSRISGRE